MTAVPGFLLTRQLTYRPPAGTTATGPVYGDPVTVPCYLEPKRQKVRGPNGAELVSQYVAICRPDVTIPPGSLVEVAGVTGEAVTVDQVTAPGLPVPQHVEIAIT
ncbi:hypothetical protein AB1484_26910 [Parafrankia sp. FMc6]|uniref:hypothetical protein n=1 Tax=Parafrankia soli TaxID=2599596 RepID=UPI0034D5AEAC